jgi:hypothetical protein
MVRVASQTSTELRISTNDKVWLFILGVLMLGLGTMLLILIQVQPLTRRDLQDPTLLVQQQQLEPELKPDFEEPSVSEAWYRLLLHLGRSIFIRERAVVGGALLAVLFGLIIILGPFDSTTASFDKATRQVTLKKPRWFFRSDVETYPFDTIAEVRVERDRSAGRNDQTYGVNLVIGHSEGLPLSRNYTYYRTVFPLSASFKYGYDQAQAIAERVRTFMRED